jgi:beta-phosphoglucomutase
MVGAGSGSEQIVKVIIFDFDGVVADTEPLHLRAFQTILAEIGVMLTVEEYYSDYLGYDDRGCFAAALAAHGRPTEADIIDQLVARKASAYLTQITQHLTIFPGVREFVREAAKKRRLAIASGALRHEIAFILDQAGIRKEFEHITSAEDVRHGKPHPEPYLHALAALNQEHASVAAHDCLVIEDSIPGIQAARAAGMKVLAVANTHTLQDLHEADAVAESLVGLNLEELEHRLWSHAPGEYD